MFLLKRYFCLLFVSVIFCISCQFTKTELKYPETSDITVQNLPQSIVYYDPSHFDSSSSYVFTAKGLGGTGMALDDVSNTLDPYLGLQITVNSWIPNNNVNVVLNAEGPDKCQGLFSFDQNDLRIKVIDPSKIDTLFECKLNIDVSAKNPENKTTVHHITVDFIFNLTMKQYAERNDPLLHALMSQARVDDYNKLGLWIRNDVQSFDLKIVRSNYDSQIKNAYALTGLAYLNKLDLSNTGLETTYGLGFLKQLRSLDLSNTKVSLNELKNLSESSRISKLSVKNLKLDHLSFLQNNFLNLEELDLGYNDRLLNHLLADDLEYLSRMKNLSVLNLSHTGLKNFSQFSELKNLTNSLNVSGNNLLTLSQTDEIFLKNILNLETLDISESNISVIFLNSYFESLNISGISNLKKLIFKENYKKFDANRYCKDLTGSGVLDIHGLKLLPTLEHIDLHGQGCIDESKIEHGLMDTSIFSNVRNLISLDISSTPVRSFEGLASLTKLQNVKITSEDGFISMSKTQCLRSQQELIPWAHIDSCETLRDFDRAGIVFSNPNQVNEFVVPDNVWSIYITGCSGANGGAGGGASGSLGVWFEKTGSGTSTNSYYVGDGGNSGTVNNNSNHKTNGAFATRVTSVNGFKWYYRTTTDVQNGGNGALGELTLVSNKDGKRLLDFPLANAAAQGNDSDVCRAGKNGRGGLEFSAPVLGLLLGTPEVKAKFIGGAGAQNQYTAWSSQVVKDVHISVVPHQKIIVQLGRGGAGGRAGQSIYLTANDGELLDGKHTHKSAVGLSGNAQSKGNSGEAGSAGANGFVKIEWEAINQFF